MSGFPNLSNIDSVISKTIKDRAGDNLAVSSLLPWFRSVSLVGGGLIIESTTSDDSMSTRYGTNGSSGRVGKRADNKTSVYAQNDVRSNRPSPTIASVSIQNGSEGLTRKCKFNITCYTKGQAQKMIQHFLEPGYYVLIEWGWNVSKSHNQKAGSGGKIEVCDVIQYQNLGVLKDKRAESEGTYDAFLGIVTGGQMAYGSAETYEVQVELTSQGELPSYLSEHKGTPVNSEQAASGIKFTPKQIEDASENSDNIGLTLFMQMYNKLPLAKQIGNIKNLKNKVDSRGIPWTEASNFLNMDDYLREDYVKKLTDTVINSDDGDGRELKVPNDTPLLSDDTFIRFELAYKILTTTVAEKKLENICPAYKTKNSKTLEIQSIKSIDIEHTLCRAHRHIFSTNKNKLYIPNKNLPDFGLADALSADPSGSLFLFPDNGKFDETDFIDGHPTTHPQSKKENLPDKNFYFPKITDTFLDAYPFDDTIKPFEGKAHEHGYLKDLYINFDFFIECMEKSGYVLYEVLLDMLNGLSSSVNLYWDFQIVAGASSDCGNEQMRVVDKTFLGLSNGATKKNDSGIPEIVKTSFQSIGVNSVFLDADFTMDIPKETANMVIAQRNDKTAKDSDGNPSTPSDSPGSSMEASSLNFDTGLFQSQPDKVGEKLDAINLEITENDKEIAESRKEAEIKQAKKDEESDSWLDYSDVKAKLAKAWDNTKEIAQDVSDSVGSTTGLWTPDAEQEIREANYDYFVNKAGVFPRGIDRNDVMRADGGIWGTLTAAFTTDYKAGVSTVLWVGTYDDPQLLKQFETCDFKNHKSEGGGDHTLNPVLLPIKFNFTIHGVSGLKVGDIFTITDLPDKYANRVFQITQIEHEVADIWTTKVESQMRNI